MATVEQRPLPSSEGVGPETQWSDRLYAALNSHGGRLLAVQIVMYFAAVLSIASLKPFWFDELITFNIARQQSMNTIWGLLLRAADPNPPLSHILSAWSMHLLGSTEIAVRLPAMCAGAVTVLCIYEFLIRRIPPLFAAMGVFFFMATRAFDYSYEARSYSFLICFASLALIAWRWTHESRRQRLSAMLLAVALALGLSSNYYGVLAFFPIAAGELVATLQRRRIAWRVWLAIVAGFCPLLSYLGLVRAAVARFSPYAWNKPYSDFIGDTYFHMLEASAWLALALIYAIVVITVYERVQLSLRRTAILRMPEFVAVTLFAAYPVLGYTLSIIRGSMISARFVIPFCVGVSIAFAISAFKVVGRSSRASLFLLLVCFTWFAYRAGDVAGDYSNQRQALDRIIALLPSEGLILVPDSLLATPLHFYAPAAVADRVVFPMDLPAIRKYKREDSPEQNLAAAPEIYSVPIVNLSQLELENSAYYVLGPEDNWLLQKIREDERPVRRVSIDFRSHDLLGFTPLAHHDVSLFRVDGAPPATFMP